MKKSLLSLVFFGSFVLAQTSSNLISTQTLENATLASDGHKKTLIEKIKEKELELQVPRETVPVEAINYPIKTPIPKTAEYLPLLQTLLHIEVGTLPNPIGVAIIGSYTQENYRVTKFNGQLGPALSNLGNISVKLGEVIPEDKKNNLNPLNNLLFGNNLLATGILWKKEQGDTNPTGRDAFLANLAKYDADIASAFGSGTKEWTLSSGKISTKTSAVGVKADTWIFPFMQLFVSGTYLHMDQETDVGWATIPFDNPIPIGNIITGSFKNLPAKALINTLSPYIPGMDKLTPQQKEDIIQMIQNIQADVKAGEMSSISFPVGTIRNVLDGWAVMGGTNLAIGYKGFFLSCMIGGGYVKLDDLANNVKGFVKKPFMYIAPRIGYSLGGVFTAHFGVQRIELFGSTSGNDLSASTGGLVQGYSVEIEKYPVNFLVGTSFTPMRDLGISFEYVTSPDSKGINAEIAYRF